MFLPPDHPEEEAVVPVDARPVSRLYKNCTALLAAGLNTVGDVRRALLEGPLTRFPGVGPKTEEAILEAFEAEEDMYVS